MTQVTTASSGTPRKRTGAAVRRVAARQEDMRDHNLSLVLGNVLDSPEPISRADIAASTGLARATVSQLVDRLVAAGMIAELEPVYHGRAGRPAVPLVPASGTIAGIGLEVNVDYLGARSVDLAGNVIDQHIILGDFRTSDPDVVLGTLAIAAERVIATTQAHGARVAGTCIALPGIVDRDSGPLRLGAPVATDPPTNPGPLRRAPNLGWSDTDLAPLLDRDPFRTFGVSLGNDANLAALAELRAERGAHQSFLYVSGEVGIGAAMVYEGRLFVGERGWSGEVGHTTIEPGGPRCGCGSLGCLEVYAGKDALMMAAGLDRKLGVDVLVDAVTRGDERARAAVDRAGWALGIALANFVNLIDVSRLVLGGIYAPLTELLAQPVRSQLEMRVLTSPWAHVEVVSSLAGPQAAMTGAGMAVLRDVVTAPGRWGAADRDSWGIETRTDDVDERQGRGQDQLTV